VLLAVGPVGLMISHDTPRRQPLGPSLRQIAEAAGCNLTAFDSDPRSNPPVSGRVDERITTRDGSYVHRRPPSELASVHALLHGRVIIQYQPSLPVTEINALDRLVRQHPDSVLLLANQTAMRHAIAATAYLNLMTCRRVDGNTLAALRAFRDGLKNFGQSF
jgi:hypothetical protein